MWLPSFFYRKRLASLRQERDKLVVLYARAVRGHLERRPIYERLRRVNHELMRIEMRTRRA